MATAGVQLWSTTAATNSSADPAVNWAEGQAPSSVNDSARAMMASVAKWRDDVSGSTAGLSTGGTSTAYTVTTNSTFATAAAMSGAIFTVIPHATSGASPTLAVDGLTARAINQSTGVAVATGALTLGTPYLVKYVHASTEFILVGRSEVFTNLKTTGTLTQSTTGQGVLATGTTAQRPADLAGGFRFNSDTGFPEFNAGAGWIPLLATLAGAQTPYGAIINGTIVESHAGNAATFALKTLAGTDPSATDPVLIAFRNATVGTGNYVYRTVTSALSLVISSGSTMGFSNSVPARLWFALFDDAGTIRIGAINCVSGTNIYPLGQMPIASSTAEGGVGGADSAQVFYTGTAVTSKAYAILAYASYESGLATAGSWASAPTRIQLFGAGVPLPGATVQSVHANTTTNGTIGGGTFAALTSGLTAAITPTSAVNIIQADARGLQTWSTNAVIAFSMSRGTSANTNLFGSWDGGVTSVAASAGASFGGRDAPGTTSSTTYAIQGKASAGTVTWPGTGVTGAVAVLTLEEIQC